MDSIPGNEGICRECFCPVEAGEGTRIREGGLLFHRKCIADHPDGYNIRKELRMAVMLEPDREPLGNA
jgi:hypothetical protein